MTIGDAICCMIKVGILRDYDTARSILEELDRDAFKRGWDACLETYQWGPNPSKMDGPSGGTSKRDTP